MKKALLLAGLFLFLPSLALALDGQPEQAQEAGSITYRVNSTAVELKGPSEEIRLKEVVTSEGEGIWAVHEVAPGEAGHDCGETEWPDAMDHIQER